MGTTDVEGCFGEISCVVRWAPTSADDFPSVLNPKMDELWVFTACSACQDVPSGRTSDGDLLFLLGSDGDRNKARFCSLVLGTKFKGWQRKKRKDVGWSRRRDSGLKKKRERGSC